MTALSLERPTVDDGLPVWRLVRRSGVLDENSTYAYCATFRHFAETCIVARDGDAIAGFVTGYRPPATPDVLFVWQVGVDADYRGQGLATRLLRDLLTSPGCADVRYFETTVTPSNEASRALFLGLARKLETECEVTLGFSPAQLGSDHEPEDLFRIGPLPWSHP